jgi:hypothetical protein
MPGLVPGIHDLVGRNKEDVDGRDKPGHDECNFAHEDHIAFALRSAAMSFGLKPNSLRT